MGFGSYTSSDWSKLKESSKISSSSTASQLFKANNIEERFNPCFIQMRDSRDSEEHPHSTPIIIGLDVTGSMGYLSAEIAKNGLNETMMKIYSEKPVEDPQMMFAAIGDVVDHAPLQVTHFESDIRIAEQLLALWLEGAGGDGPEDYPLLWYFAAKHTYTDAFARRREKGFIFTIGDADCHEGISAKNIKKIFDDEEKGYTSRELAEKALEKYELFHIDLHGSTAYPQNNLRAALPGRLIKLHKDQLSALPDILIAVMQFVKGKKMADILKNCSKLERPVVENSLNQLSLPSRDGEIVL